MYENSTYQGCAACRHASSIYVITHPHAHEARTRGTHTRHAHEARTRNRRKRSDSEQHVVAHIQKERPQGIVSHADAARAAPAPE